MTPFKPQYGKEDLITYSKRYGRLNIAYTVLQIIKSRSGMPVCKAVSKKSLLCRQGVVLGTTEHVIQLRPFLHSRELSSTRFHALETYVYSSENFGRYGEMFRNSCGSGQSYMFKTEHIGRYNMLALPSKTYQSGQCVMSTLTRDW